MPEKSSKSGSRWKDKWGVFQLYFLPIFATILFAIVTLPQLDLSIKVYVKNDIKRWILKVSLFLLIIYIVNLAVFNKWEEEYMELEDRCENTNEDYESL